MDKRKKNVGEVARTTLFGGKKKDLRERDRRFE